MSLSFYSEHFQLPPTICDVCNGTGFGDVRVFKGRTIALPL